MTPLDQLLRWLDLAGVAVFAASGALVASRKRLDVVGMVVIASVAGFGGGTVRDLLLGRAPVFWLRAPELLAVCAAVAVFAFFAAHRLESRFRALLWADAVGMALYAVVGAEIALLAGASPWAAVLMGVVTSTFGGVLRDVICNELPLILRREIYATAAAAGAAAFVALRVEGVWREPAVAAGVLVAFGIRAAALLVPARLPGASGAERAAARGPRRRRRPGPRAHGAPAPYPQKGGPRRGRAGGRCRRQAARAHDAVERFSPLASSGAGRAFGGTARRRRGRAIRAVASAAAAVPAPAGNAGRRHPPSGGSGPERAASRCLPLLGT